MLFSIQILIKKVLKNSFFQLLARWFWRMLFSIQFLIEKVLKNCFFSFWQDFGFGECFLHEVIAEFFLPKTYLPELEKYILSIFVIFYICGFFSILEMP